jgi:hypothetical protein
MQPVQPVVINLGIRIKQHDIPFRVQTHADIHGLDEAEIRPVFKQCKQALAGQLAQFFGEPWFRTGIIDDDHIKRNIVLLTQCLEDAIQGFVIPPVHRDNDIDPGTWIVNFPVINQVLPL